MLAPGLNSAPSLSGTLPVGMSPSISTRRADETQFSAWRTVMETMGSSVCASPSQSSVTRSGPSVSASGELASLAGMRRYLSGGKCNRDPACSRRNSRRPLKAATSG